MKLDREYGVRIFAEFCATVMLMALLPMACVSSLRFPAGLVQISVACGLVICVCIQCFGSICQAHINPSVSLGLCLAGFMKPADMGIYFIAQFLGAFVGYGIYMAILPPEIYNTNPCLTIPNMLLSDIKAIAIEFVLTSTLVLFVIGVFDPRNVIKLDSVSLRFTNIIWFLVMIGGHFTGTGINPARTLAPAIWQNNYSRIWIYFVANFSASICMGLLYRFVFRIKEGDNSVVEE